MIRLCRFLCLLGALIPGAIGLHAPQIRAEEPPIDARVLAHARQMATRTQPPAPAVPAALSAAPHLTGLIPLSPREEAKLMERAVRITRPTGAAAIPSSSQNIQYLPAVRSQLLNNCGAFAPTYYYKTYQEAREHGWTRPDPAVSPERIMSPGFTYPLSNNGVDSGASISTVMNMMCRYGVATWASMPESGDYSSFPNESQWRNGAPYRASDLVYIDVSTSAGITALKEHLAGGDPAVVGVLLYHDTYDQYGTPGWGVGVSNDVIYANGVQLWDWHALTIIGYDDNKSYVEGETTKHGAFLAVNSWGPGWGVNVSEAGSAGFAWLSYDYVMSKRGGDMAGGAYTMVDRISYQPTDFAVIDLWVNQRRYLNLWICVGSAAHPVSDYLEAFPTGGGTLPFAGTIALDVTDFVSYSPVCYDLSFTDLSAYFGVTQGTKTGGITRFAVQRPWNRKYPSLPTVDQEKTILAGVPDHVHAGLLQAVSVGLDDLCTQSLSAAWCDWNHDGFPDLALAGGALGSGKMLRVYRNVPGMKRSLQNVNAGLPDLLLAGLDWADYDGDGLPDLAAAGNVNGEVPVKAYRNLGLGGFVDSGFLLPTFYSGNPAWGDYNNDGKVDLLLTGVTGSSEKITRIYRNTGSGLVDSGVSLPQKGTVAAAWVDVNCDGWLDLMLGGDLYRNNADGTFALVGSRDGEEECVMAWGDYNGDGLPDLAYSRMLWSAYDTPDFIATRLFQNNGGFAFTDADANLPGVRSGSLAWGDFDNDGRPDLAISGYDTVTWDSKTTRLYRQLWNRAFQDTGTELPDVAAGSVAWVDFDGDSGLDLIVTGHGPNTPTMFAGATAFLENQYAKPTAYGRRNTPPSTPAGQVVEYDAAHTGVRLKWNAATDAETPAKSLSYRVRVGRYPGGSDVLSPAKTIRAGDYSAPYMLSPTQPGRLLCNLSNGLYYWSVQSVDGALTASPWSVEQTFVLGASGLVSGDANADGRLDVADVVAICEMAAGKRTKRPDLADLNGDGAVGSNDAPLLAEKLIGASPNGYVLADQEDIGPAGGTLLCSAYEFELVVPAGALAESHRMSLEVSALPSPLGNQVYPISWRLNGMPVANTAALKLRMKDFRTGSPGNGFFMLGRDGFARGVNEVTATWRAVEAVRNASGWLEYEMPVLGAMSASETAEAASAPVPSVKERKPAVVAAAAPVYDYTLVIYLLSDSQWRYDGGHFRILAPLAYKDVLPSLATTLEEAYTYYTTTLGFNVSRRDWTKYPVEVTVMDLGCGSSGEPVAAYTCTGAGYNDISIEINKAMMNEPNNLRVTAAHEFFHVVQTLQDTRNRLSRMVSAPNLWIDEATATYLQGHFADTGDNFTDDLVKAHKMEVFDGYWRAGTTSDKTDQNYGYGMTQFIKYLARRHGNTPPTFIKTLYDNLSQGYSGLYSIQQVSPGYPADSRWFSAFYDSVVADALYPDLTPLALLKSDVATPAHCARLSSMMDRGRAFPEYKLRPLSAGIQVIDFQSPWLGVTSQDRIGFEVLCSDSPDKAQLNVLSMIRNGGKSTFTSLPAPSFDPVHGYWRLNLPDASQYVKQNSILIPIVCNSWDAPSFDTATPSTLYFGVYQDYPNRPIASHTLKTASMWYGGTDLQWPYFTTTGSFSASDVTRLHEGYKNLSPNQIPGINVYHWGCPIDSTPIQITSVPTAATLDEFIVDIWGDPYQIKASLTSDVSYRLVKYHASLPDPATLKLELVSTGSWQSKAEFSLDFDQALKKSNEGMAYDVDLQYTYSLQAFDDGGELVQSYSDTYYSTAFWVLMLRQ